MPFRALKCPLEALRALGVGVLWDCDVSERSSGITVLAKLAKLLQQACTISFINFVDTPRGPHPNEGPTGPTKENSAKIGPKIGKPKKYGF